MTNYEWLVKQDLLGKFLKDFNDDMISAEDIDSRYGHIPNSADKAYSEDVAAWLQKEHKEPKQYVELEEILDTISRSIGMHRDIFGVSLADKCEYTIRDLIKCGKIHIKTFKEE